MLATPGVIPIETSAAALTVSDAFAEIVPEVAVIVAFPIPIVLVSPPTTVAMLMLEELHVTVELVFCVVPSVYVPVAVNCSCSPFASVTLTGVMPSETSAAGFTVRLAVPVKFWLAALMLALPVARAEASPLDVMLAIAVFPEVQATREVRSSVLPSENCPVALNCWLVPLGIDGALGETVTPVSCGSGGGELPPEPPLHAVIVANKMTAESALQIPPKRLKYRMRPPSRPYFDGTDPSEAYQKGASA